MDPNLSSKLSPCRAAGLPICEPEPYTSVEEIVPYQKIEPPEPVKILNCDCIFGADDDVDEVGSEEQDEEQSITIEELQLDEIQAEVERSKKRVDLIGQSYFLHVPDCPIVDECVNMKVELNKFKTHPEILELQRSNEKLLQQIRSLQLCTKATDVSLKDIRERLCRDLKAAVVLQQSIDKLESFKRTMMHEHALCRQRYRHLMEDKYEWIDCLAYVKRKKEEGEQKLSKFVTRIEYKRCKRGAIELLNKSKILSKDVHDFLNEKMVMKRRASSRSELGTGLRLNSDIAAFLQRNHHLFNKEKH